MIEATPDTAPRRAAVAAAIVAGGRGTRMGTAGATKGLLPVQGRPIIERQIEVLRRCFDEVIVVANDPALGTLLGQGEGGGGLRVVADRWPGVGPLAGLDAALDALPPAAQAVVCVAGDMPFLSVAVLELLRDSAPEATAVVPWIGGHREPLLARYGRACAPIAREQLQRGDHAMWRLLARLPLVRFIEEQALRAVDPDLRCLFNVNTPDDLAAADAPAQAPGPMSGDRGPRR